jgi:hypothetical protein
MGFDTVEKSARRHTCGMGFLWKRSGDCHVHREKEERMLCNMFALFGALCVPFFYTVGDASRGGRQLAASRLRHTTVDQIFEMLWRLALGVLSCQVDYFWFKIDRFIA